MQIFWKNISNLLIDSTDCTRDGSEKPGTKKCQFSQAKKATKGSSFWVVENGIFCEDLQRTARNGAKKTAYSNELAGILG